MDERLTAFDQFTQACRKRLQGIANATGGEQEFGDVVGQAWIIADGMIKAGVLTNMLDPNCQNRLLRELYRYFQDSSSYVRRHPTLRLDVNEYDDDPLKLHPSMQIPASDSPDPLVQIIEQEEPEAEVTPGEVEMELIHSLAGAYRKLLDFFDGHISNLAEYLCMSIASVRRRCDYVARLASLQRPLPYPLPDDFTPDIRFARKAHRRALQLAFEFSYQLELEY